LSPNGLFNFILGGVRRQLIELLGFVMGPRNAWDLLATTRYSSPSKTSLDFRRRNNTRNNIDSPFSFYTMEYLP
jgi:hypothetical protein